MTEDFNFDNYFSFITDVMTDGKIYSLKQNDESLIFSYSREFIDEQGDPFRLQPFWSSSFFTQMKANQKEEWEKTKILEISIRDFLEHILDDLDTHGFLVGINLDEQLNGPECSTELLKKHLILYQETKKLDKEKIINELIES